ncbi:MAG: thiosulfate sulfurtransferase GlpE [bacterium]
MDEVKEIDLDEGKSLFEKGLVLFVDVRDAGSFQEAHIPGAIHLNDQTVANFIAQTDKQKPVVVYCYLGHTSQGGAAYLMDNGFTDVASLQGGFELWRRTEKIES